MMINTNAAAVLGFDALTRCVCGSYDAAIEHAEKALQLSPLEPLVCYAAFALALACLLAGRAEEAVRHARKAIEGNRNFVFPHCVLALGCARLGYADEAAQTVRRLVRAAPNFRLGSLRKIGFADQARLQSDLELLGEAQLPHPT
jgi:tetratricopeptide (TPR) repeat protein